MADGSGLKKVLARWRLYWKVAEVGEVARRYFVMNAFDGALTMLGVVIGSYLSGIEDPQIIIAAGVAGALAMGISGVSGAYMTESAERKKRLKELERAMLRPMRDTIHEEAHDFATTVVAIVDGLSPALAAICVISPFFAEHFGLVSPLVAFYASVGLTLAVLVGLGMYLAKISDESMAKYGARMLLVGVITAGLCIAIAMLFGATAA
ncbi:MAG: VIT1/CCC1 transporter family protein [Methanobacteriota archaeon]